MARILTYHSKLYIEIKVSYECDSFAMISWLFLVASCTDMLLSSCLMTSILFLQLGVLMLHLCQHRSPSPLELTDLKGCAMKINIPAEGVEDQRDDQPTLLRSLPTFEKKNLNFSRRMFSCFSFLMLFYLPEGYTCT